MSDFSIVQPADRIDYVWWWNGLLALAGLPPDTKCTMAEAEAHVRNITESLGDE